jgi:hypothetical protein
MKKWIALLLAAALLTGTGAALSGCTAAQAESLSSTTQSLVETLSAASSDSSETADASAAATVSGTSSDSLLDTGSVFTSRDLEQTADTADAVTYTVEDGRDITITEEGVYVITGTASDCTIYVNADDTAKVQLVLDGVSITNTDAPAIYVVSADKCFVTTTDSENTLAVTGTFAADGETNLDAVIFSKADLTLNGAGTLTIASTANGVTSKDDLRVTGGTYSITAGKHGLEGKDSIAISGGTFAIEASEDGLHSENADDASLGWVYISGGVFQITAGDDGVHSTTVAQIDGGELTITAAEGIEGTSIQINDGTISIEASDDGINAAAKSAEYDVVIELNGGTITIVMGSGDTDAVDANGSIYVNGGTIDITANSAFDYDVSGELNGGTVTVNGSQITEMTNSMPGGMGGMGGKGGRG